MLFRVYIIVIFIIVPLLSFGQLDSILKVFTAIVDDDQIIINWTMAGGYQCNGTVIERSVDGETFYRIGDIPGLCGDPVSDESYSYVDTAPQINNVNFYRLNLQFYGVSFVIQRSIYDLNGGGYLILPNPIISSGRIKFENPIKEEHVLQLFSMNGQMIYIEESNEDYFILDSAIKPKGIYLFVIRSESGKFIRGKIVIGNI